MDSVPLLLGRPVLMKESRSFVISEGTEEKSKHAACDTPLHDLTPRLAVSQRKH